MPLCNPKQKPTGSRRFVLPGYNPGLIVPGNLDIYARPSLPNPIEGGCSSVLSISFGIDEGEVLVPQIWRIGGRWVYRRRDRALTEYRRTGKHLGIFDSVAHANRYSDRLHIQQARIYCGGCMG